MTKYSKAWVAAGVGAVATLVNLFFPNLITPETAALAAGVISTVLVYVVPNAS